MSAIITVTNLSKRYQIGARRPQGGSVRGVFGNLIKDRLSLVRRNGQKRTTEFWALKDVTFTVNQGEALGIIGRNGAGKTTLLKILSRITEPTSGKVELFGRVGSLLEVGTGFHPELTGRENIFLNGSILGMTRGEIKHDFDEIVAFAEMEQFIDTPVKRYSSGMYVRLAFAVAAHLKPEILIVDEVLAVGDSQFQQKCLGKMSSVAKEGRTVLFVSHNLPAVRNLCERSILLESGALQNGGPTPDIIHEYLANLDVRLGDDLELRTDRTGNGRLRCVKISLLDAQRVEVPFLYSGQNCYIQLDFKSASARLGKVKVGIGIDDLDFNRIATLFSDFTGESFEITANQGKFTCAVTELNLRPDTYLISVYLGTDFEAFDCIIHAARVEIHDSNFFGTGKLPDKSQGPVLIRHNWSAS